MRSESRFVVSLAGGVVVFVEGDPAVGASFVEGGVCGEGESAGAQGEKKEIDGVHVYLEANLILYFLGGVLGGFVRWRKHKTSCQIVFFGMKNILCEGNSEYLEIDCAERFRLCEDPLTKVIQ